MAVGTKDLAPEQLRGLDDTKLADELKKAKEELVEMEEMLSKMVAALHPPQLSSDSD